MRYGAKSWFVWLSIIIITSKMTVVNKKYICLHCTHAQNILLDVQLTTENYCFKQLNNML